MYNEKFSNPYFKSANHIKWLALIFVSILFLSYTNPAFAWGDDKYCTMSHISKGLCQSGDLLKVPSVNRALQYCDFDKPVVSFSSGDADSIGSDAICYYRGSKREKR